MSVKSSELFYSHLQKPAAWWSHGHQPWEAAPSFLSKFWSHHDSSYRCDCKRQRKRWSDVPVAQAALCDRLLPAPFQRRKTSSFVGTDPWREAGLLPAPRRRHLLGWVPGWYYQEKDLSDGGHSMSYAILRLSICPTKYQQFVCTCFAF